MRACATRATRNRRRIPGRQTAVELPAGQTLRADVYCDFFRFFRDLAAVFAVLFREPPVCFDPCFCLPLPEKMRSHPSENFSVEPVWTV